MSIIQQYTYTTSYQMKTSNILPVMSLFLMALFSHFETEAQKSIPEFELGKNLGQTTELKLSDLATEISYIPLELTTKSLLAGINIILPAGNLLVVATRDNKIKVFDQKGKYINDIGNIGKGPGEFGAINTVFWDDKANEIIVYNSTEANLIFYSLKGKHLRSFKVPYPAQELFRTQNGTYLGILFMPGQMGSAFGRHFIFNTEGMVKPFMTMPSGGKLQIPPLYQYASFCRMGDKDLFVPTRSDTVYVVEGNEVRPFAVVNTNGKMLPDELYYKSATKAERSNYISNLSLQPVGNKSFCVEFQYQDKDYAAICNTATGKITVVQPGAMGIPNDLDGGFPFRFEKNYLNGNLYTAIEAIYLMSAQKEGWIKNPNQKYLDVVKGLKEDSNPVIIKTKLKEN